MTKRQNTFSSIAGIALLLCALSAGSAGATPIDLRIHWIEPAWVPASSTGTVEVSGLGFDSTVTATLDGATLPASALQLLSPTRLRITLPPTPDGLPTISTLQLRRTLDPVNIQTATKIGGIFRPGAYNLSSTNIRPGVFYVRPAPDGNNLNSGTTPAAPKATIEATVDAAFGTNDSLPLLPAEIRVASGTYAENVRLPRGAVVLGGWSTDFTQRDPDRFVSIIDGRRNNLSAVRTSGATENFCLLDGFTITNSRRTGAGGAFRSYLGGPTLTHNVMIGNVASKRGAGVYLRFGETFDASATIAQNLIVGNRADELSGGGVLLYAYYYTNQGDINVAVTDNLIVGNRAILHGGGVAVGNSVYYTQDRLNVSLSHNRIQFNRAENGGALAVYPSMHTQFSVRAHNNLMGSNRAEMAGGAVYFAGGGGGDLLITSSTLVGNSALQGGGLYRAVPLQSSSQFTALTDDILWSNTGGDLGDPEAQVVIHYTDSTDDFSLRGAGNFSLDPRFVPGPFGPYYLDPASPVIDSGSDFAQARALSERTTLAAQGLDSGRLDLGTHYPVLTLPAAAPPQLLHLVPAYGSFLGSDWVLLRGSDFRPGARVTFDGSDATRTLFVAGNRLLAEPQPHTLTGTSVQVPVLVINPNGQASSQTLSYRYLDADPPAWDSTLGVISADSPSESTPAIIVRWNPALDAVSPPVRYNIHREPNTSATSQLIIPQASNLIASGLLGTSYVDRAFVNRDVDSSFVYRVRALDSAFLPNEEMNLTRVFGIVRTGTNALRPDPAVYLLGPREATSGDTVSLEVLVSNQGTATASSLTLEVSLPADLIYVAASTRRDGAVVADNTTGTPFPLDLPGLTIANLAHSTSTRVTFQVRVNGTGGLLSWVGVVASPVAEVRTDNNRYERYLNTKPRPGTDMSVTKTGPVSATTGSAILYSIRVANNGTLTAQSVVLTDTLPASGLAYVNGSARRDGAPLPDNTTGTPFPLDGTGLALGTFTGGDFTAVEFTATLSATSGSVINQASVSTTTTDLNPSNNVSQAATRVALADLGVIAAAPLEALQGSTFELSTSVSNTGDADALNAILTDALPASLGYVAGSARRDGAAVLDGATGTPFPLDEGGLALGSIAPGATTVVTFSVTALQGSGTAIHTASVSTSTAEVTLANNSSSASTALKFVNLALAKSAPAATLADSSFSTTLTLSNTGSAPAPGATLTDMLPDGATYVAGSTRRDGTAVPDDVSDTPFPLDGTGLALGSLAAAGTTTITFSASAPAAAGLLVNTATASTSAPESGTANNTGSATTRVVIAELGVTAAAPAEALLGSTFELTASVSNSGDAAAEGTTLSGTLPDSLAYVAGSTRRDGAAVPDSTAGTPFPFDESGLALGSLAPGAATVVSFSVSVLQGAGTATHTASVTTTTPESTLANNTASASTTLKFVDLTLTKTAPVTAVSGSTFSYTLRAGNMGSAPASAVTLTDTLSAGVSYTPGSTRRDGAAVPDDTTGSPFPLDEAGLALGSLAPATTTEIVFGVTAPAGAGTLTNSASAATSSAEPDTANNTGSATTGVVIADLGVTAAAPAEALQGSTYELTASVSNTGDAAAEGTTLSDTLPGSLAYVAGSTRRDGAAVADGTAGTPFPLDGPGLALGSLAPGASTVISFSVRALEGSGTATHAVSATTTTPESTLANNTTSASTALKFVDLTLTKTAPPTAVSGSTFSYTLRAGNMGSAPASAVTLTDTLPAGVTYAPGSTRRDGAAVPDDASGTPFPLDGPGLALGSLAPASTTEIVFGVTAPAAAGGITNTATVATTAPESSTGNNAASATTSVFTPQADLVLLKTAAPSPVVGGGSTLRYTLMIRNDGDLAALDTRITDTLPGGVTFVSATPAPSSITGSQVQFTLGALAMSNGAPGGPDEAAVVMDVRVDLLSGSLTNVATASTSTYELDLSDNSAQVATTVLLPPLADLVLVKTAPTGVAFGERFTYQLSLSNTGTGAAAASTLLDTLPAGVTYVAGSTTRDGSSVSDDFSGTPFPLDEGGLILGDLAVGASTQVRFEARAPAQAGTITNSASAATTSLETDLSDNQASAATQVTPRADLSLDKSGPLTIARQGTITYTLTAANLGPSAAASVVVTDLLPTGSAYLAGTTRLNGAVVSDATSGTAFRLDEGGLGIGSLNAGATATLTFQVRAPNSNTQIINQGSISSATADPNPGNGSDWVTTFVGSATSRPDLTVLMNDSPDPAPSGSTLRYTLTARNDGTQAAAGVTLTDTLPSGVTFLSAVPTPASVSGNAVQFSLGSLTASNGAAGGTDERTITLDVRVDAIFGSLTNAASVATTTQEATTSNNSTSILTAVQEPVQADLVLSKQAPASAAAGARIVYTLGITNAGGDPAATVVLRDTLPAGVAYVAGSTTRDGASVPDGGGSTPFPLDEAGLGLGTLAAGASTSVRFEATLTATSGSVTNSASVTTTSSDTNPVNNSASAATSVLLADLVVSTTAPVEALQNSMFEIAVQVANTGQAQAQAVTLSDTLSGSLAYVAGSTRLAGAPVPDDPSGTLFPLDEAGLSLGSLATGATSAVSFSVRATDGSGTATHTASAATSTPETTLANNSASSSTALSFVDLTLTKTAPPTAASGSAFSYTLRASNTGSSPASAVALTDTLPAGVTYTPGSTRRDGATVPDDASGTPFPLDGAGLALGSLAPATTTEVIFDVTAPAAGDLTNTATASTSAPESGTANNTGSATTRVLISDLGVSAAGPAQALQGSTFELSASISNSGDAEALNVVLTDALPASLSYIAGSTRRDGAAVPDDTTGSPFPVDESGLGLGSLAPGATTVISFSVLALEGSGTAAHTASATTSTPETTLANNSASSSTILKFVDLALIKTAPGGALPGATLDYTLRLTNLGSGAAAQTVLSDVLPAGAVYVAGTTRRDGAPATDDVSGTPFPLDEAGLSLGSLAAGSTTEVTFQVTVAAAIGPLTNTATAATSAPDTNPANDSAQAVTLITLPASDVTVAKSALAGAVSGREITYTIAVSVPAAAAAPAVAARLIDTLPAGASYVPGSTTRGGTAVPDDAAGTPFPLDEGGLELGDLAPGSSTQLQFRVQINLAAGNLTNQADVSTLSPDTDTTNNSAQATTLVSPAGSPLTPVGNTLRWDAGGAALLWDPAPGNGVYFVHRADNGGAYASGSAARLTPLGTTGGSWATAATPDPGRAFFYRVNAGDGQTETDELHMADLIAAKSAPASVLEGTQVTYTILVRNVGAREATSALLSDPLPAEATYIAGTTRRDGQPVADSGSGTSFPLDEEGLEIGPRPGGSFLTFTFEARLDGGGTTAVNRATVSTGTPEHATSNNIGQVTTAIGIRPRADLSLGKTDGPDPITGGGGHLFYYLSLRNDGDLAAENVEILDTLPVGVTFLAASQAPVDISGRTLRFALGTLAASDGFAGGNDEAAVNIEVRVDLLSGTLTNQATASTSSYEPNLANNTAQTGTIVQAPPLADLVVTKSAPAIVTPGQRFTYDISVTNTGTAFADSTRLLDTLPAGVSYVPGTTSVDGFLPSDDPSGTPFPLDEEGLDLGTIGMAFPRVVRFDVLAPATEGSISNTASASTSTLETDLTDNQGNVSTPVRAEADLVLTKSAAPDPVTGGGSTLRYTLSLRNDGPQAAAGVGLTDTLPAGVTFLTASPAPSSVTGSTLTFALGALAASDGAAGGADETVVTIDVRVDIVSGSLTNQASCSTTTYEVDLADNSAQTVTGVVVPAIPDLVMTKQAPTGIAGGQRFTYILGISNTGSGPASNVLLVDTPPAGVTYVAGSTTRDGAAVPDNASGTPFPIDAGGLNLGTLAAGGTTQVRFDVTAPVQAATLTNSASVGTSTPEPDLTDNQASASTQVLALTDLTLDKTGPVIAARREFITYTLAVTNRGPGAASSILVTDTLQTGVNYTAGSTRLNGAVVPDATTGTPFPLDEGGLNIGSLSSGAIATVTFQTRMPNSTVTVINRASVSAQETDPNTADNSDSVTTFVDAPTVQADLALTKSDSADPVTGGGTTLRYTLIVRNDGTLSAAGVTLTDTLPSGATFLAAAPAPTSVSGATLTFALGSLAASNGAPGGADELTVTIDVRVTLLSGSLLNQASITTSSSEANPANNTAQAYTTVEAPVGGADLSVIKQAPASVVAGDTLDYTLTVSNAGPLEAQAVTLVDTLPAGAAYVPGSSTRDGSAVPDSASGTPFPLDGAGLDLATLAAGASTVVRYSVTAPAAAGTLSNSASVSSPTPDPDSSDNTASATTSVTIPDLVVTAAAPAEALQGASFGMSLGVSNAGNGEARSVAVSDALPVSLAYVPGSTRVNGTAVPDAATGTPFPLDEGGLSLGNLAPGASSAVSFSVLAVSGSGTATHTASATTPTPETSVANNSASAGTALRFVDLSLVKSGPANALSDATLAYSLQLSNLGSAPAPGAVLSDALPAGVSYVAGSTRRDGVLIPDSTTGTPFPLDEQGLALGDLAGGATTEVTFSATAPATAGTLTNTAGSTSTAPENRSDNNSATAVTQVALARADLALSKADAPDPITGSGTTLRYTLTVRNDGNISAANVTLTDTLPAGVTFLTATPAPSSVSGATLTFALGTLAAFDGSAGGADETQVAIDVQVDVASGTLTNQASVSTSTPEDDLADNSAQTVTTVVAPGNPDLVLTKQAPVNVTGGQRFTYVLDVSNTGTGPASNVILVDTLPAGATYVAGTTTRDGAAVPDDVSGTPFPLDAGGLNLGTLVAAAATQVRFDVTAPAAASTLTNTAGASTSSAESDLSDNQASAVTQVNVSADLAIDKQGPATVTLRQFYNYTLIVTNNGPGQAVSVIVTDTLPQATPYTTGSTLLNGVPVPDDTGTTAFPLDTTGLNIGNLASGASATITFQVRAPNSVRTSINQATVSSSTPDPISTNNTDSVSTSVQ